VKLIHPHRHRAARPSSRDASLGARALPFPFAVSAIGEVRPSFEAESRMSAATMTGPARRRRRRASPRPRAGARAAYLRHRAGHSPFPLASDSLCRSSLLSRPRHSIRAGPILPFTKGRPSPLAATAPVFALEEATPALAGSFRLRSRVSRAIEHGEPRSRPSAGLHRRSCRPCSQLVDRRGE